LIILQGKGGYYFELELYNNIYVSLYNHLGYYFT